MEVGLKPLKEETEKSLCFSEFRWMFVDIKLVSSVAFITHRQTPVHVYGNLTTAEQK